jgi:hypothetical protein
MRVLFLIVISLVCLGNVVAQVLDISSGGAPTIAGALGGSVTGSSNVQNDLVVTINFGEVSAANTNNYVKVTVPIALRSRGPYRVTATILGIPNANPNAIQATDVGFGIGNWRKLGGNAQVCSSPHILYAPFNNDPSSSITLSAAGRAQYVSDLADIGTATTIITGPRLSSNNGASRKADDGWIFDAVFVITPQFYAAGISSATITFNVLTGPVVPC